jgi:hypothetical protein
MKETNKQTARIAFLWLQISQYLGWNSKRLLDHYMW